MNYIHTYMIYIRIYIYIYIHLYIRFKVNIAKTGKNVLNRGPQKKEVAEEQVPLDVMGNMLFLQGKLKELTDNILVLNLHLEHIYRYRTRCVGCHGEHVFLAGEA